MQVTGGSCALKGFTGAASHLGTGWCKQASSWHAGGDRLGEGKNHAGLGSREKDGHAGLVQAHAKGKGSKPASLGLLR